MRKPKFLAMTLAAALVAGAVFEAPVMTARAEETAGSVSETVSPGNSGATVSPGNSGTTVSPGNSGTTVTPGDEGGSETPSTPGDESGSQTPSTPGDEGGSQTPSTPGDESGTTGELLAIPQNNGWATESYSWGETKRFVARFSAPNWNDSNEAGVCVLVRLYKDGEEILQDYWGIGQNLSNVWQAYDNHIFESGVYKFSVCEQIGWSVEDAEQRTEEVFSEEKTYIAPDRKLGKVQDIEWDTEQTGVFYFTPLEGGVSYYAIHVYRELDDGTRSWAGYKSVSQLYDNTPMTEDGRYIVDMSDAIRSKGEGVYYVTIQAYSSDIEEWVNGEENTCLSALDTYARSEEVSGKIADAIAANAGDPVAAAAAVRAAAGSVNEAATQMQLSAEILNQISELETAYNDAQGITVNQTVSPEAAARGVSTEGISIVGAGFNAADNSTVTLNIGVPAQEETLPSGYRKGVQLDISLEGAQTDAEGRLLMPVTITMPAPDGVDLSKLTLFHYHNGRRNSVAFRYDSATNTITFTVTSFSTFLFAEEGTDETQPDGGNTPSGDAVQPDNGSQSGSGTSSNSTASDNTSSGASSASSVTVEKKTPVALTYVVQRGDNMYRIARKHGLTLAQLVALNPQIKNPARIYAGQVLIVGYTDGETADAANAEYDIVKKGDSLYRIAARNGLKLIELKTLNPKLFAQRYIFAGQKVRVK